MNKKTIALIAFYLVLAISVANFFDCNDEDKTFADNHNNALLSYDEQWSATSNDPCNCRQGCCSWHGGVVCIKGISSCADGKPLSMVCNNCIGRGCPGCE